MVHQSEILSGGAHKKMSFAEKEEVEVSYNFNEDSSCMQMVRPHVPEKHHGGHHHLFGGKHHESHHLGRHGSGRGRANEVVQVQEEKVEMSSEKKLVSGRHGGGYRSDETHFVMESEFKGLED
ncbi:unnamed protein product [Cuscuta epithymum]|uniref:Uncharacterized protein n=1 Tax=Cuscuta epithymum TaxID=186058 RepID=A0AAV0CLE8_9ASTE|nr:unnamed protein product [Cuscuta epithymum]